MYHAKAQYATDILSGLPCTFLRFFLILHQSLLDFFLCLPQIRKLSSSDACTLLHQTVERLLTKAARGAQMGTWLRSVLVYHAGYLMSAPGTRATLTMLYQGVHSRMVTHPTLVTLSGRLDLVLCQASRAKTSHFNTPELPQVRASERAALSSLCFALHIMSAVLQFTYSLYVNCKDTSNLHVSNQQSLLCNL